MFVHAESVNGQRPLKDGDANVVVRIGQDFLNNYYEIKIPLKITPPGTYAKGQEEARQREQALQANADKLRRDKDAEIRNINARATALTNSLRDRQTRPTETNTVPSTASARPANCSGKELYREDGEFLVRLAAEADGLKAALDQCYRQYDAARQK